MTRFVMKQIQSTGWQQRFIFASPPGPPRARHVSSFRNFTPAYWPVKNLHFKPYIEVLTRTLNWISNNIFKYFSEGSRHDVTTRWGFIAAWCLVMKLMRYHRTFKDINNIRIWKLNYTVFIFVFQATISKVQKKCLLRRIEASTS